MAEPDTESNEIALRAAEVAADVTEADKPQDRLVRQVLDPDPGTAPFGERVEVAAECGQDGAGEGRRGGFVDRLVGQHLDLALEVRQRLVERQQPEPLRATVTRSNRPSSCSSTRRRVAVQPISYSD